MKIEIEVPNDLDIIDVNFLKALVENGILGCRQHNDTTWKQENRPERDPFEHLLGHAEKYQNSEQHELGDETYHLVAIAYNAMMEYYWAVRDLE